MSFSTRIFGEHGAIIHDNRFRVLFFANATGALGIPVVAPILDSLTGPFAVPASRIGLMTTIYTAPGVLMIPLAGVVADRYGRKPTLLAGLLLFGFAGSAITLTTDFAVVLLLRLLQGIGFAGIIPVVITSIGDIYDGSREATAQGVQFAALGLSTSIFSILAGALIVFGWRYPILLYAMGIPVAVMVYLWFEESMTDSGFADDCSSGPDVSSETGLEDEYVRNLARYATNRRAFSLLMARTVPSFIYVGFLTYCSFAVVELVGGTPQQAGVVVGAASLVNAVASTQAGRVAEMFGDQLRLLLWTTGIMAVGMVGFGIASTFLVAVLATLTLGIGFGLTSGVYRSVVTGLVPTEFRGGLVSLSESLGRLAATVAPVFIGGVISVGTPRWGYAASIKWAIVGTGLVAGVFGLACLLVAVVTPPEVRHVHAQ